MTDSHPHLNMIQRSIDQFRCGALSIEGFQLNLSAVEPALGGDLPCSLRRAVRDAEADLELLRFTIDVKDQHAEAEAVCRQLENAIGGYL